MSRRKENVQTVQENEPLTMAQTLQELLNSPDEKEPGQTMRQSLCAAMIERAKDGDMKAMAWVFEVSGEESREKKRKSKLWEIEHGFR